jgi:hypothetical protein
VDALAAVLLFVGFGVETVDDLATVSLTIELAPLSFLGAITVEVLIAAFATELGLCDDPSFSFVVIGEALLGLLARLCDVFPEFELLSEVDSVEDAFLVPLWSSIGTSEAAAARSEVDDDQLMLG